MPYKDKDKQKEYYKQWKADNKEAIKQQQLVYQKTYQKAYKEKKYELLINDIEKLSYKDQKEYLLKQYGPKRQAILRRMNNLKLEQDIQTILKQKRKLKTSIRQNNHWNFVKNWTIKQGCNCGENNISKLSFHHLDPSKKENNIRRICGYSMDRILEELKKGIIKCKNCHTIIHAGTSPEREEILINQYYNKKPNKRWAYKNKLLIWELKKSLSCIKCGINDPAILLFHHIDSKLKSNKISTIYESGREIINQELLKTICLCHNCHEDFHYIYSRKNNTLQQLEKYIGQKVIPIKVNIEDYLPLIEQKISVFSTPTSLIA